VPVAKALTVVLVVVVVAAWNGNGNGFVVNTAKTARARQVLRWNKDDGNNGNLFRVVTRTRLATRPEIIPSFFETDIEPNRLRCVALRCVAPLVEIDGFAIEPDNGNDRF